MVEYSLSGSRCAVIGGVVYRGSSLPWLEGAYLYADYCSGEVWGLRYDGEQVAEHTLLNDSVRRSFRVWARRGWRGVPSILRWPHLPAGRGPIEVGQHSNIRCD